MERKEQWKFSTLNLAEAKHSGRKVILRKDWEQVKIASMKKIVQEKFRQNPGLRELLLHTGNHYLEEGNYWGDKIWGTVNGRGLIFWDGFLWK